MTSRLNNRTIRALSGADGNTTWYLLNAPPKCACTPHTTAPLGTGVYVETCVFATLLLVQDKTEIYCTACFVDCSNQDDKAKGPLGEQGGLGMNGALITFRFIGVTFLRPLPSVWNQSRQRAKWAEEGTKSGASESPRQHIIRFRVLTKCLSWIR